MRRALTYLLTIMAILLLCPLSSAAQERRDSVVVSLITCWPGGEVYELCGHEALRVRGVMNGLPVDSVWNYGVFDFNAPNFVYRFVKGETDYMLVGYPFAWFLPEYQNSGRKVLEQDLNLTPDQTLKLLNMLREEGRPENRTYRYNYVRDNCATRIVDRIDSAAGSQVVYPDNVKYGTFRNEMRAYHRVYPWYQFGIDLALGSGIDVPLRGRQEMFVPVEMAEKAEGAHFADGRPLVKASRILNAGIEDATEGPTPWWLTPVFVCWMLFLVVAILSAVMLRKRILYRWVMSLWFVITGLAGCLISFLVFISSHEATSPNVLILWLNPLPLILAFTIWSRRLNWLSYSIAVYNIVAVGCLMLVWGFQRQSANPAFFPLMGITIMLSVVFALTAKNYSSVNKKNNLALSNRRGYGETYKNKKRNKSRK